MTYLDVLATGAAVVEGNGMVVDSGFCAAGAFLCMNFKESVVELKPRPVILAFSAGT